MRPMDTNDSQDFKGNAKNDIYFTINVLWITLSSFCKSKVSWIIAENVYISQRYKQTSNLLTDLNFKLKKIKLFSNHFLIGDLI